MKFGHVFKETLRREGYPPDWVDSAISYSQLKKCINRLTSELAQVGLDPATLGTLLKQVENYNASKDQDDDVDRPFEYILSGGGEEEDGVVSGLKGGRKKFHPKLLFYVDEVTGEVHSAKLDEDTKSKLQMLAVATGVSQLRVFEESDHQSIASKDSTESTNGTNSPPFANGTRKRPGFRTVEIPLTSDTEFFATLTSQLSGLEALQTKEEKRMHVQIDALGKQVAALTDPDKKPNKKLISVWRQIFQIYVESGIFFGTTERDHTAHDADKAAQRFLEFSQKIKTAGLVDRFKKPESITALSTFMHINREILQGLRFGEINHVAMLKILKSKLPLCHVMCMLHSSLALVQTTIPLLTPL
jgi:E3 ubiquitin-protein ligase BAH